MKTASNSLFVIIASPLVLSLAFVNHALAVGVAVTRVDDKTITVKISVSAPESIKDFHFDKGALVNGGALVPTSTDEDGLGWSVSVAGNKINVFGGMSVVAPDTTFTIKLPQGVKWGAAGTNPIILTNDGDADAQTGVVTTATGQVPSVLVDIPTVSEWGLVVLTLLCMIMGTVALAWRRRGGATQVA